MLRKRESWLRRQGVACTHSEGTAVKRGLVAFIIWAQHPVVRWPGIVPSGVVSDQVGITMDLAASFARLAGVKQPQEHPFDGVDLLTLLVDRKPAVPRMLFWRGRRGDNA